MSTSKKISVVIPTYNCGLQLRNCLKSIKWADEIIVVDMGSTDDTLLVAKKYGSIIYKRFPKGGNFDLNRKFGMEKAKSDWILKLDSDETIDYDLQNEIRNFLKYGDDGSVDGLYLYNKFYIFGRQIKHGFIRNGSNELRLVRNNCWLYNPYRYHQQIKVEGKKAYLKGYYCHYNYRSVSEFIFKTNKYTEFDASRLSTLVKADTLNIVLSFPKSFLKFYFIQLGFLDGVLGLASCFLFSLYYLIEKIKVREYMLNNTQ